MEDREFCSECLLSTEVGKIIGSSQKILDELYAAHQNDDFTSALALSKDICDDLASLDLDYQANRISGISHIYGLWGLGLVLRLNGRSAATYKAAIVDFYNKLRDTQANDPNCEDYKKSMTSRTRERFMRVKRVNALLAACGESALKVD
jgi:hypothetical protein